ncbi:cysteine proteinase inhibitor B [Solanum dulcamara]|uniref:cysteine proteinase inhibitor B n=1 Tax=Solanum dulcamara TaxID=45834 RepID=UPI002485BDE6|nr:cysteine proteinase inhibitor B [Solanum dulcamara]
MAKSRKFLLSILLLFFVFTLFSSSNALGGKLGGRTQIKHVKTNQEIQDLGKYCIEEHNRKLQEQNGGLLSFSQVVEAEKQVVSGIKYYLKISATTKSSGSPKMFDAVVVVIAWEKKKELLTFSLSPSPATK